MHCIAVSGENWEGKRAAEVLGYHHQEQTVNIICMLIMKNQCPDGEDNYLEILHPGKVLFEWLKPWPLPKHPDENAGISVLGSIYNKLFKKPLLNNLNQVKELSSWDSWCSMDQGVSVNFLPKTHAGKSTINQTSPTQKNKNFEPFTSVSLGPFIEEGYYLISFSISLLGSTYNRLVSDSPTFPIDGPSILMKRISEEYFNTEYINESARDDYDAIFEKFKNFIPFNNSYDIIVINDPKKVDPIKIDIDSSIVEAPIQSNSKTKTIRYITRNPKFALSARYSDNKITDEINKVNQASFDIYMKKIKEELGI